MPALRSQDILVRAARLYYLQDKSQGEIAAALGISRSSVSRILAAAREQGVVEVRIHPPGAPAQVLELEDAIRDALGIASVTVVARPTGRTPTAVVGEAAARIFEDRVLDAASVGLSWGRTIEQFVDNVTVEPISTDLRVYPLVGGIPKSDGDSLPAGNTSMEILAAKCGALAFRFESPAVVESRESWAALTRESSIIGAIERAARVDLAFVGIGSHGVHASKRVLDAMRLDEDELNRVEAQRPAGDVCGRFYDLQGEPLGPPTSERVIGVTLAQLADIPEVIGMAGGAEKAPGVVGALRTGALDAVVLDEGLARAVLELVCR